MTYLSKMFTRLSAACLTLALCALCLPTPASAVTFTFGSLSPTSSTTSTSTTFTIPYGGGSSTPTSCNLYMRNTFVAAMTVGVDGASYVAGRLVAGDYANSYVTCVVGAFSFTSSSVTVTVTDDTPPTLRGITPYSADPEEPVTISLPYSDNVGVVACHLFIASTDRGIMTLGSSALSGTATFVYTFPTPESMADSYDVYARCVDAAGNATVSSTVSIIITAPITITSGPTSSLAVGAVLIDSATQSTSTTFSATFSDTFPIVGCDLYLNAVDVGAMTVPSAASSGTATLSYAVASSGSYTAFARCTSGFATVVDGASSTFTITLASSSSSSSSGGSSSSSGSSSSGDGTSPTVGAFSQSTSIQGTSVTFVVSATDSTGIASCQLFQDDSAVASATFSGSSAVMTRTFADNGAFKLQVVCTDIYGNTGSNPSIMYVVTESTSSGILVKTACPATVAQNDPCTTVYYVGADGKRHAFTNEKDYATWYADFNSVQTISAETMASYTLGKNVTYRPGVRMVKFVTSPVVYAVDANSVLRPINSESTASVLYGSDWNKKIDDINDAFYGNYTIGSTITGSADYSASAEMAGTITINGQL